MAQVLTISELEKESGVPRSTIHYYLREGLLPQPQKTADTRALYSSDHLALLRVILEAKAAGRSLSEIRVDLRTRLDEFAENTVDLEAQEHDRIHRRILRLATRDFVRKGYRSTRLSDVIRESGVSSSVFYGHFPTKRHLLVESYCTLIEWSIAYVEPRVAESADMVERLLARSSAGFTLHALDSDVMALVGDDSLQAHPELLRLVRETTRKIDRRVTEELVAMRDDPTRPGPVPDEILAYVLGMAYHAGMMRVASDDAFALLDFLRTMVWLWLAVRAAMSERVDLRSELARYEDRIREVAIAPPPVFPDLGE